MCTNSARLVNSLECYMDDLVDCFEDFVKKSLLIISVAVGALIVMFGYVLKVVTERTHVQAPQMQQMVQGATASGSPQGTEATISCAQICKGRGRSLNVLDGLQKSRSSTLPQKSTNSIAMPCLRRDCRRTTSAAANTGPLSSIPSFNEKLLRNIGLSSCSKNCIQGKRSVMRNCSTSRLAIPSIPTCIPNHHISTPRQCSKYMASRNSCCSMCCADDDRR